MRPRRPRSSGGVEREPATGRGRRYARPLGAFTGVFEAAQADSDLPEQREPADDAVWFVAHVADVLPSRA